MTTKTKQGKAVKEVPAPTMNVTDSNLKVEVKKDLGRPVDPNSARQQKLAKQAERKLIYGDYVPLGRQADPNSKRQQMLKEQKAKKEAGIIGQRGRPKMTDEQKAEWKAKRDAAKQAWLDRQASIAKGESFSGAVNIE